MIHFIIEDLAAGLVFDLGDRGIIPPHIGADRGAGTAGFSNQVTLQVIVVDSGLCPFHSMSWVHFTKQHGENISTNNLQPSLKLPNSSSGLWYAS